MFWDGSSSVVKYTTILPSCRVEMGICTYEGSCLLDLSVFL